jgi:polysaccharide pyruvyl transferase CsaB
MRDLKRSTRRLLIAGHYGFGNLGDEAILASILDHLHTSIRGVQPVVVSGDPDATSRLHGISAIHWTDIASIIAQAEECDAILLGGGGLFHDYWNFDPSSLLTPDHSGIAYYAGFPVVGATLEVPVAIVAAGVGPLLTQAGKEITRLAFENAAHVTVRDAASKKLLEEIGIGGSRVAVTADAAFALDQEDLSLDAVMTNTFAALPRPLVGVALRSWNVQGQDSEELAQTVAEVLDRFVGTRGGSVVFFSFQSSRIPGEDDAAFAESVRNTMRFASSSIVLSGVNNPVQMAALIARVDLVLAMRLHSVIFALKAHTPFAAIVYDPKVRSVVKAVACEEYAVDVSAVSSGVLYDRLTAAFSRKHFFGREAARRVTRLRDSAVKALAGLSAILERAPQHHASIATGKAVLGALSIASTRIAAAREETERLVEGFAERQRTVEALGSELEAATARANTLVEKVAERQAEVERFATEVEGLAVRNRDLEQQLAERDRQLMDLLHQREHLPSSG